MAIHASDRFAGLLALAVLLFSACSQEKDAFLNRTYHKLTARDNGWFNGNEKLKEIIAGIETAHVDNYDEVLPLFVYGTEEQAKNAIPELEKCIDKCSVVIDRHTMNIEGKEKNTWIDDAWFVIAKSQFYKRNYSEAERGFTYVSRRYKGENRQTESLVWLARTAIQLEQYGKAQSALDQVKDEKTLPKKFDHGELSAVQAELELKRGKVDDAIIHLEAAIPNAENKKDRVRWAFILAQLYQLKGLDDKAIKQFAAVGRMNPPYEMAFHTQIFQALAFNTGDSKEIRRKLNRMLRDDKHIDHFDMLHYAIADIDLKERKDSSAIDHLLTSAKVSTTDQKQKAKTFLRLADLYFDDRAYPDAQKYYDSTQTLMAETHPRLDEVKTRARVLGELVEQLAIIQLEDSLQRLAKLDPKDLEKKIRGMIRDREDEEAAKLLAEEEARAIAEANPDADKPPPTATAGVGRGTWYFYDPQQIGRGLTSFRKKWGNRKLEDDWRRKDKSGSALAANDPDLEGEGTDEVKDEKEKKESEWKDPAFYTKDIPKDDAALEASNARVCSAYYVSGMIYKEQLKDADNAIESFEVLNSRFEECRYTPESYYQLYRIYLEKEQTTNYFAPDGSGSKYYADIILERWPDSEFARLVRDPNILQADEARKAVEEAAYKEVYDRYRQYMYNSVITSCNGIIENEPRNHFLAKYHMLRAMAIGGLRDISGFRAALAEVQSKFPGTDEERAAAELLAALDRSSGGAPPPERKSVTAGEYKDEEGQHFFALIVPNEGSDMNAIKVSIATFNRDFYPATPVEITSSFLDPQHQVVLLSPFESKEKAMEYFALFNSGNEQLVGINDQGYPAFAIGAENYAQLFRSKDVEGYNAFFSEKYLDHQ
ncbi:MAG TPA: tetratricopeptide repeat protein [Flavobacteriales bacterium]|nr:tetratricopeptide repeat protein [Flavobacteriales bacterium]